MVSVNDVAAYVLQHEGPMTAMKLHKLCYYSQAWAVVWDEAPLFTERIEAWANGPVIPALYQQHRGQFTVAELPEGDSSRLSTDQRLTVDAVLKAYGRLTAQQLSVLTHEEGPWRDARRGLDPTERSNAEVSVKALAEFYGSMSENNSIAV